MHESIKFTVVALIAGAIAGVGATFALDGRVGLSDQDRLIRDFYAAETAVMVSPHGLRKKMDKGDNSFILVDLRSPEEYEEEHITGAISVHAYTDKNTSAYGDVNRIVESFRALEANNPDKQIVVYCYSIPCMTGRKVGNLLAQNGVFVKELGVGWNEWRYFWTLWNHPHEWETTSPEEYITSGTEPGEFTIRNDRESCPIEGELGC